MVVVVGVVPYVGVRYFLSRYVCRMFFNGVEKVALKEINMSKEAPYGYCPICGKLGIARERSINGNDICESKHRYPSRTARYKHLLIKSEPKTIRIKRGYRDR